MNKLQYGLVIFCTLLSFLLRFSKLEEIPSGFNLDEASQGYNAFSIINTGKDRYGQPYPLLFRSFGSYQPPVYTYLTVIPTLILGNRILTVRFISALAGSLLPVITFFIVFLLYKDKKERFLTSFISLLVVLFAPWAVIFSRLAVEANLGLFLFVVGLLFFLLSLKKDFFLLVSTFFLGLSTNAYYSERITSVLVFLFILIFFAIKRSNRKILILSLVLFVLFQIPHIILFSSGAFTRRLDQVGYLSYDVFSRSSHALLNNRLGRMIYIGREFITHYLTYFSPKNLFYDIDPQESRSMPGLSVFYFWMVVPYFVGMGKIIKNFKDNLHKFLLVFMLITPIPGSLTSDPFYTLRVLGFLWAVCVAIALGINTILRFFKHRWLKITLSSLILIYSVFTLYVSYFILFKYERAENYGHSYIKLLGLLDNYSDYEIFIDSYRDAGVGVRLAYLKNYDPDKLQSVLSPQMESPYYSGVVNMDEVYVLDNLTIGNLNWNDDLCETRLLIGDKLAISDDQVNIHRLKKEFGILNLRGEEWLRGYFTTPDKQKCHN